MRLGVLTQNLWECPGAQGQCLPDWRPPRSSGGGVKAAGFPDAPGSHLREVQVGVSLSREEPGEGEGVRKRYGGE